MEFFVYVLGLNSEKFKFRELIKEKIENSNFEIIHSIIKRYDPMKPNCTVSCRILNLGVNSKFEGDIQKSHVVSIPIFLKRDTFARGSVGGSSKGTRKNFQIL